MSSVGADLPSTSSIKLRATAISTAPTAKMTEAASNTDRRPYLRFTLSERSDPIAACELIAFKAQSIVLHQHWSASALPVSACISASPTQLACNWLDAYTRKAVHEVGRCDPYPQVGATSSKQLPLFSSGHGEPNAMAGEQLTSAMVLETTVSCSSEVKLNSSEMSSIAPDTTPTISANYMPT